MLMRGKILIPPVYKTMQPREEIFCMANYLGKWNVCTKFRRGLVELTWNDPRRKFDVRTPGLELAEV